MKVMHTEFLAESPIYEWEFRHKGYPHFDSPICKNRVNALLANLESTGKISHSFYPLIKVFLPKYKRDETGRIFNDTENPRPIMLTARIDSNIYSFYRNTLMNRYESLLEKLGISESIIAYRKIAVGHGFNGNKCNIHFANEAIEEIKRQAQQNGCVAMALDISKFFDSLDHNLVKRQWCRVMGFSQGKMPDDHFSIFKNITRFKHITADKVEEILNLKLASLREKGESQICRPQIFRDQILPHLSDANIIGIPQGTTISDVIANMYMLDFDTTLKALADAHGGYYRRYSDDILLICPPEKKEVFLRYVDEKIAMTGTPALQISHKKTLISEFRLTPTGLSCTSYQNKEGVLKQVQKPFEYLGFSFDGKKKRIRQSTLSRFHQKLSARIRTEVGIAASKLERKGTPCTEESLYKTISFDMIQNSYMCDRSEKIDEDDDWGNFYTYVRKASEITETPEMMTLFEGKTKWIRSRAWYYCKRYVIKKGTISTT
jgi:RNA-directed DNA polymerase